MNNDGFSLIELIIVISIIAIISLFAFPSYHDSITRARRTDGQTALFNLASRMENFYAEYHSYEEATIGTGQTTDVLSSNSSDQNYYQLTIISQSENFFELHAIPKGSQAGDDKACQTLTLDSTGKKGIIAGSISTSINSDLQCW